MLPIGWGPQIALVALLALSGMVVGATSGSLISQFFIPTTLRVAIKDALWGALGAIVGFLACVVMPWPQNTITTTLADHSVMQVTVDRFQHPEAVAFALAVLLPAAHQIYRHWRLKSVPSEAEFAIK